ncbi:hypothetical protein SAMN02746089_02659 [Caldanaerobius fijiensis DSM 17918]|uniref:Uncharacterized protein n=2 Tax=Caldanaerobius TaxID=862261 RepID=A0A1M5F0Q8_9THEO|nr:hypothetical protein SAMN02746089_02659 [Caldanaerobius fijiensis DSM 17918]
MPTVEQCTVLKAWQIPNRGMTKIGGLGINATPEAVSIVSKRFGQRIERIKLPYGGNAKGGFTLWLKCPTCGRKTHTLYLPPRGSAFACRRCLGLTYSAWKRNGYVRFPKDAGLWLTQFVKKAKGVLKNA